MRSSSQVKPYLKSKTVTFNDNIASEESSSDSDFVVDEPVSDEDAAAESLPDTIPYDDENALPVNNEPTINQQWVAVDESNIIPDRRTRGQAINTAGLIPSKFK